MANCNLKRIGAAQSGGVLIALLLVLPALCGASIIGEWVMESNGIRATLTIRQSSDGMLEGTLSGPDGKLQLEGLIEDGVAAGMVHDDMGALYFEAHPEDGKLLFYLIEAGFDGEPDYDSVQELPFTRAGSVSETPNQPGQPAAGEPTRSSRGGGSPSHQTGFSGVWRAQGDEGPLYAVFESRDSLVFDGERCSYTDDGRVLRVQSTYQMLEYPYSRSGDRMTVDSEGMQTVFEHLRPRDASLLHGRLCHSSGYSKSATSWDNTTIVSENSDRFQFDGRGGFTTASQSSFSGTAGGAVANSFDGSTDSGRYYIAGDRVILIYGDGSLLEFKIHHCGRDGNINELELDKEMYAAGFCE